MAKALMQRPVANRVTLALKRLGVLLRGMTDSLTLLQVENEMAAIARQIAALRDKIRELEALRGELEVAARVVRRLSGSAASSGPAIKVVVPQAMAGRPKTYPDTILAVLGDSKAPLSPSEVIRSIQELYRPDAKPDDIRPTLWRMWKEERISKNEEGAYYLRKEAIGTSDTESAKGESPSTEEMAQLGL
jgi:hypothetical protein